MWLVILFALLGALLGRWNSGPWPPKSHTIRRAAVAGAFGLLLVARTGDPWTFLAGLALWLGLLMPWAPYQDLGRVSGKPREDFIGMTVIGGALVGLPTGLVLAFAGYPAALLLPVITAFTGCAYWLAWAYLDELRWGRTIDGPTVWGELARGALGFGGAAALV